MKAAQIADLSGSYGTIGNAAIWAKVTKYGFDRLYGTAMVERNGTLVPDAQALSPATLKACHDHGIEYGIVRVPTWTNLGEAQLAKQLSADLTALGATAGVQCAAMANAEAHTFDIAAFLAAWRKPRPWREIGWGIEGMQGGRISTAARFAIVHDLGCIVYGECYRGNMFPQAADAVRIDLEDVAKIPRARVKLYYPNAPDYMDGITYVLEDLP